MAGRSLAFLLLAVVTMGLALFGAHHCCKSKVTRDNFLPPSTGDVPAPTCERLDCPPYKTVHAESDFEIREYSEAAWVGSVPLLETSLNAAVHDGFLRLFKYIGGANEDGAKVPMTAPVLTTLKSSGGPFASSSFTVKLYVPPEYEGKPPTPDDDLGVSVATLPRCCVAVRRFPGFATDSVVPQQAKYLAQSLQDSPWANITAARVSDVLYAVAQYNDLFTVLNRVNEVWVPFHGTAACSLSTDAGYIELARA